MKKILLTGTLLSTQAFAQTPLAPDALPEGGRVVAGEAAINAAGATLSIEQVSDRAAVDWDAFDVGSDATVEFVQPSQSAVTLNRVTGADASRIFGRIAANGQVFLSNPNGVYFAPGASVDAAGLVATTHGISVEDFMAGRVRFERNGATGSVVNEGELRAALGGYVALLAPEVRNQGVILANLGTVALAAGETFELEFGANNTLANLRVTPSTIRALVENRSAVLAPGGIIILSAQAVDRIQSGVIRNSGVLEATGLARRGGRIVLEASGGIENFGSIDASATADGPAGSVSLTAAVVESSGSIDVSGSAEHPQGGSIAIAAQSFAQAPTGRIDASAPALGGTVTIAAEGDVAVAGRIEAVATSDAVGESGAAAGAATGGTVTASAAVPTGGIVAISGAHVDLVSAVLDTSGATGGAIVIGAVAPGDRSPSPAPLPSPDPRTVALSGTTHLISRGRRGNGGSATLTGDDIALGAGSTLTLTGTGGGGRALVGGDWQGAGDLYEATRVRMDAGARIDVSATANGAGGTAVLWSDLDAASGGTRAHGEIRARGGASGGDGGRIETSGHAVDVEGLRVDAAAPAGRGGAWLIDPYNYTIDGIAADAISSALEAGTSVIVTTTVSNPAHGGSANGSDAGSITVTGAIQKQSGGDATLTLQAHRGIDVNAAISSTSGKLNVVLWSDYANENVSGVATTAALVTNGGHVWIGGSSTNGGSQTWNGLTVGDGPSVSSATDGMQLGAVVSTAGGDVLIWAGEGDSAANNGIGVAAPQSISAGSGDVTLITDKVQGAGSLTVGTTGTLTLAPHGGSFEGAFDWVGTGNLTLDNTLSDEKLIISSANSLTGFVLGRYEGMSGTTITNSSDVTITNPLSIAGPISIYGGRIAINGNVTSTATGDIFIKSTSSANPSIDVNANILKTGGARSTLTLQAQGSVLLQDGRKIEASSGAVLDTILWSDYDNSNDDGGVSLLGMVTTNGGHLWAGGSSSNGGSYTWNGLTVGDGPSIGTTGFSDNALEVFDSLATAGGDVLLWAGNGAGAGTNGVNSDGTGSITAGAGDVTLLMDTTAGAFPITTTGLVTFAPNDGGYGGTLDWSGNIAGADLTLTGTYADVVLNGLSSVGGLTLGQYRGFSSGGTPVTLGNTSDVSLSVATSVAGPIEVHGGNVTVAADLSSTLANAGLLLKGTNKITLDGSLTTGGGDITLWANSAGAATGGIEVRNDRALSSSGGWITLGGSEGTIAGLPAASALGTALPQGYARNDTSYAGISLGTDGGVLTGQDANVTLDSSGGRVALAGHAAGYGTNGGSNYSFGVIAHHGVNVSAGSGDIVAHGLADGAGGASAFNFGLAWSPFHADGGTTTTTWTTQGGAIALFGSASGNVERNFGLAVDGSDLGTAVTFQNTSGGGGVTLDGTAAGGTLAPIGVRMSQANVLAAAGTVDVRASAGSAFVPHGSAASTLGQLAGSAVALSNANVTLSADTLGAGDVTIDTGGALTVQPTGASFSGPLSWPGTYTVAGDLSALTLGKPGNVADITIDAAQIVAGPIAVYGGSITVDAGLSATGGQTITLQGAGSVTDGASGFVSALNLLLLGGNVALDSASNGVGTLAATGVGNLTFVDGNTLVLGTVGGTQGIAATGVVDIGTLAGHLTVLETVATTNASATALTLNAGMAANAGTAAGGNLYIINDGVVGVGAGGTGRLFTGSVADSGGVTALVGSGSGRFRYGSDETTTGYTLALGTGLYAIYREQPTVTRTINDQTIVYGSALPAGTLAIGGGVNGDTFAQAFDIAPTLSVGGAVSTSGNPIVGTHALTGSGGSASSQLGYAVSGGIADATLTVTPRTLNVSFTGSKVYDGNTAVTLTASDDRITNDVLTIASTAAFADANAGAGKTVNVTGIGVSGADAANYAVPGTTATASADITPRTVTLDASRVYDGTVALGSGEVTIGNLVGAETLAYNGAAASDAHVATAGKYVSAINLLDGTNGGLASNYQLPSLAAANAPVTITARPIGASAAIGGTLTKVYDGTTAAPGASASGSVMGAIAGDVLALDTSGLSFVYDSAHVAAATSVSAVGAAGFTIGASASGSQATDYSFTAPAIAAAAASITPATLAATLTNAGVTKAYDGTTNAPAGFTPSFGFTGLVAGDTAATLTSTGAAYDSKDVATASSITVTGLAINGVTGGNGSAASDYVLDATSQSVAAAITPRIVSITGVVANDKVYDGTAIATLSDAGGVATVGSETLTVSAAAASFGDPNAGAGKTVTVTGYALADGGNGGLASNYALASTTAMTTATITKAELTVIANDDAKFVTQADAPGYNGVSYAGFVNGETAAVLSGSAAVGRTNAGTDTAGVYADVLQPDVTGLSAANYSFVLENGDYTIVPASQLLVRVANGTAGYGAPLGYTITSAEYLDADTNNVIALTSITDEGDGRFTVSDNAGGSATFTVALEGAQLSTAGHARAGAYQLEAADVATANAQNFSNELALVGSRSITQRGISATTADGVSKVYDGTTAMTGVEMGFVGAEAADDLDVSGMGQFATRNAGTNIAYAISGTTLGGADAANYYLTGSTSFSGTNGTITPRTLDVTYGGVNKVYDGNTSAAVTTSDNRIVGDAVTIDATAAFADKNVGSGKAVTISAVTLGGADGGNYVVGQSGSTTADITRLDSVAWVGGAGGQWFDPANWAGGAVPDLANVANVVLSTGDHAIFDTTGAAGLAETGPVHLDSIGTAGYLTQNDGELVIGAGGVRLDGFTQHGGILTSIGDIILASFAQTGGSTATEGDFTVTADYSQSGTGTVTVGGDANITDVAGGTQVGNVTVGGDLNVTSTGGDLTQTPGTTIQVGGAAKFEAPGSEVVLDQTSNHFPGGLDVRDRSLTLPPVPPPARPGVALPAPSTASGLLGIGGDDVAVSLVAAPTDQTDGVIAVSVPRALTTTGFGFALPDEVTPDLPAGTRLAASGENGERLPAWLTFDAQSRRFDVARIPASALPVRVAVTADGRRWTVVIAVADET